MTIASFYIRLLFLQHLDENYFESFWKTEVNLENYSLNTFYMF